MNNSKYKDIIDISTVGSGYNGNQLRLYAKVGDSIVEAFFDDVDQLYEFAPTIGFAQKDVAIWFLTEASNSSMNSQVQNWFITKALRLFALNTTRL